MMDAPADLALDPEAESIVRSRLSVLNEHLILWAADDQRWSIFLTGSNREQRERMLSEVMHAVRVDSSLIWRERLYALGQDLGMLANVYHVILLMCRSHGWFDQPVPKRKQPKRPDFADVEDHVLAVIDGHSTVEQRTAALVERGLCKDSENARLVAQEYMHLNVMRAVSNRVCALLQAWSTYGHIGLLHLSDYPFYEEMRLVEAYFQNIACAYSIPDSVIAEVRADIIALCKGISRVKPRLWHQNLLSDPPNSVVRQRYQDKLSPLLHENILPAVAQERGCDSATAEEILNIFISRGLAGLSDRRLALELGSANPNAELLRAQREVERLCSGMNSMARQEIERLIPLLFSAIETVGIPLSRVPLLIQSPSSRRRVRWGRQLAFGVPSIVRRKHQRRRKPGQFRRSAVVTRKTATSKPSLEPQLIKTFAEIAGFNEREAKGRLRNLITYGVLGLLPKSSWYDIIDARIFSWLQLMKIGHVERAVLWSKVYQFAQKYSAELGVDIPSSHVLRAIYNSIVKPAHWHGGSGLAVIQVHKRRPRVETDRPRLHAAWLIIKIKLNMRLLDSVQGSVVRSCYLLLAADAETQLPVGGWVSAREPQSREVALAIYQAIWHPGAIHWPVRGIPEIIHIPPTLVVDGCEDIQRAAAYLLADVDITDKVTLKEKKRILRMVEAIKNHIPEEIHRVVGGDAPTESQALRIILDWLLPRYFPYHRNAHVSVSIRENLVGMPGHDTPAAGWLLLVTGTIEMAENSIESNGRHYTTSTLTANPGQTLLRREFPYFYPSIETLATRGGIFIEVAETENHQLHYLSEM